MTEKKHTPGPWTIDKRGVITGGIDSCTSIGTIAMWNEKNSRMIQEASANARLVAAAPELLACCEDVLLTGGDSLRHWGNAAQLESHKAMLAKARTAISKANPGGLKISTPNKLSHKEDR